MSKKRKTSAAPPPPPAPPTPPRSVADLAGIESRVPAPDGRLEAIVYDRSEYRMGWYDARIVVADGAGAIVERFGGHMAETTQLPEWSDDSAWIAFPACTRGASEGEAAFFYFAWHVEQARFGVVRVGNPYPLIASFVGSTALRLEVAPTQIAAANNDFVFGGGRSEAPVRRFRAPTPVEISLASLVLAERSELDALPAIVARAPFVDLGLLPDGFHPYDGPGLKSTTQQINGRPLEGHHLESFADYGDEVAREWLEEVRRLRGERYDRWAPVAPILGRRAR